MTPKEKAEDLIEVFESEIGHSDLNVLPEMELDLDEETSDLAKGCAINCCEQILSLSGLPQYQIVFWRDVLKELNEI